MKREKVTLAFELMRPRARRMPSVVICTEGQWIHAFDNRTGSRKSSFFQ